MLTYCGLQAYGLSYRHLMVAVAVTSRFSDVGHLDLSRGLKAASQDREDLLATIHLPGGFRIKGGIGHATRGARGAHWH